MTVREPRVVLSIHDVAPATLPQCRELRDLLAGAAGHVPVSLLVVPHYHGDPAWPRDARDWLCGRADGGDEVVLHGLEHRRGDGRDGPEFDSDTAEQTAAGLLALGRSTLAAIRLRPEGFVAPAYAHPSGLDAALRTSGLRWWATRVWLHFAGGRVRLPSIGLGASTIPRRALSPAAATLALRLLHDAPVVRLDLHPADVRHPRLAARVPWLIERALAQGRRPVRHADLLG